MKKKVMLLLSLVLVMSILFSGCSLFESMVHDIKGTLIGVPYNIEFYDHYGEKSFITTGEKIDIEGNFIEELGVDSSGNTITNYVLSSVITITIDGKEMESCGDTVIFAESGLKPDIEFSLSDISSESNGNISNLTSAARLINKYKNYFGKSRVVVIKSQLGVPICAYSGKDVYWEVPDDLPKTTKLMVDGKALYIHRANFQIIDLNLIK